VNTKVPKNSNYAGPIIIKDSLKKLGARVADPDLHLVPLPDLKIDRDVKLFSFSSVF
jgi:hypothetical protein